jgi:dTMP kinase
MARGKFISLEGGEGSGKSTQARLLHQRLEREGFNVLLTREPGGSAFAEQGRALILDPAPAAHTPLSEALLFFAARCDHLDATIRPALAAGRWVVCDRFSDSTRVYQGNAGGLAPTVLDTLESLVVRDTVPDLTVILDVPAGMGLSRAGSRRCADLPADTAPDAYERRHLAFHEALRAGYRAIADAEPGRCILIDATRDRQAIAEDIWGEVARRLLGSSD